MQHAHRSLLPGTCLLTELTHELKEASAWSNIDIVLPTQRLCLYLTRELALNSKSGAAVLPRLWTWDRFVENLIADSFGDNLRPQLVMVSSQCELIMDHLLALRTTTSERPLHTNQRHAHELVHLSAELARSGQREQAKERLLHSLENDWRRTPESLEHLCERLDDVFAALDGYEQTLTSMGWSTKEHARSKAVKAWMDSIAKSTHDRCVQCRDQRDEACDMEDSLCPSCRSKGPRRILIAGLTSLPPIEAKLLGMLSRQTGVSIWLDTPPNSNPLAPLNQLRHEVGLTTPSAPDNTWAQGVRSIKGCSDITHEITYVMNEVAQHLAAGVPGHEIAIIVPDESQYAAALAAFARCLDVPVNMPLASSWSTSSLGRWLRLVTELGTTRDIHRFGQYILHPFTRLVCSAPQELIKDELRIQRELKHLPEFGRDGQLLAAYYRQKFTPDIASYVERALNWCFRQDDANQALADLPGLIDQIKSHVASKESPAETRSFDILKDSVQQVLQLAPLRTSLKQHWTKCLRDIYQLAQSESIRDVGEPLSGVQMIGLTEARYIPFSLAYIVGCVEGSFPHALPRDSLVDNQMRRAMGLPGWGELEALEDTTFHLLTGRLPHVHLTYPQSNAEAPLTRSRWIERLATKIPPKIIDPSDRTSSVIGNFFTYEANATESPNKGPEVAIIPDADRLTAKTSASRLRHLLWCPYQYLLLARGVEGVELPDDRVALKTGDLLHQVLEAFFHKKDIAHMPESLQWRHRPNDHESFGSWAHDRLDQLARILVPASHLQAIQFQHMTGRGWESVALFWQSLMEKGWHPDHVATELEFGKEIQVTIPVESRSIAVHGKIDAIFANPKGNPILLDYKTSIMPLGTDVELGLEPQLPLYAYVLTRGPVEIDLQTKAQSLDDVAVAYYSLSLGKPSFVALGEKTQAHFVDLGLLSSRSRPRRLDQCFEALVTRWSQRLRSISDTKAFAADPSDCSLCSFAGICRKDDPRYREQIKLQQIAKPPLQRGSEGEQEASLLTSEDPT